MSGQRRTVEITLTWPARHDGRLVVDGKAADHRDHGSTSAAIVAYFGDSQRLLELTTAPEVAGLQSLLDIDVAKGFRRVAQATIESGASSDPGSALLHQLLDELPVGLILAGYRKSGAGKREGGPPSAIPMEVVDRLVDVCVGWQRGSEALRLIAAGRSPIGDSPPLATTANHNHLDTAPLPPDALRRSRSLDVTSIESGHRIDAWFRDSFRPPDGPEVVLHEYAVEATLERGELATCVATPVVLPFGECPGAAANVSRLVGTPLGEIRSSVSSELGGVEGCTHLNDLLRSLGAVEYLID